MNQNSVPVTDGSLKTKLTKRLEAAINRTETKASCLHLLCFALPALMLFLVYFLLKQDDFYPDLYVLKIDMSFQYVYFFAALQDWIAGEGSLLYSFSRALGGEFLGIFTYYVASPLSFIVGLFSKETILDAIMVIYLAKCGLSGLFASIYLRRSAKVGAAATLLFSTLYAMCGYAVVMHINIMWIDGLMLLPLLALSIERLITQKKYFLFVLIVALNLLCNYYVGYMSCLFAFFYFFYAYFSMSPEERNPKGERYHFLRAFMRIGIFALIAIAISAICILPAYYSLTFGKDSFTSPTWDFEVQFPLFDLFVKFLFGTYDSLKYEGIPHVYCGVIVLLLVPLFFLGKTASKREKICSAILLSVFVISFSFQYLNLIWHGFQPPQMLLFRYAFMLVFLVLVISAKVFERAKHINSSQLLSVTLVLVLLILCTSLFNYSHVDPKISLLTSAILIVLQALLLLLRQNPRFKEKLVTGVLVFVVLVECYANSALYMAGQIDEFGYSKKTTFEDYYDRWHGEIDYVQKKDKGFYRLEKLNYLKYNDSYLFRYRGLANSTSTLNRETLDFINLIGHRGSSNSSNYIGANPVVDSLLGIRYILDDSADYIPTLYEEYHTDGTITAYKNPYALSIAFLADDDIERMTLSAPTTEEIASLATSFASAPFGFGFSSLAVFQDLTNEEYANFASPFERLNRMVSAILGEDVKLFYPIDAKMTLENVTVTGNSERHSYTAVDKSKNAEVIFTYEGVGEDDIFAYFPSPSSNEAKVYVDGKSYGSYFTKYTHGYIRLGPAEEGTSVTLKLRINNSSNVIRLSKEPSTDKVANCIYALDGELFTKVFERLAEGNMTITDYTEDSFKGTIQTKKDDSTVLTTIPYDAGWQITVDGKAVEPYKTVDALLAFRIDDAGEHEISLRYAPPIYTYALYITLAGLVALILIMTVGFIRRRKHSSLSLSTSEIDESNTEKEEQ